MIDTLSRVLFAIAILIYPISLLAMITAIVRAAIDTTTERAALVAIAATSSAIGAVTLLAYMATRQRYGFAALNALAAAIDCGIAIHWRSIAIRRRETIHNALRHRADQQERTN